MKKISYLLKNKKIKLFSDLAKNKKIIFVFLLIFFLGIFLRVYHHRDWLLFHLDQSRDALIVSEAIENGPAHLPLLGPHASGTGIDEKIYLGPAFYYFQYFFVLIFGNTPDVLAWPDLFFSILSIPLFYFFIRKYFSQRISLLLTLLVSSSFFLVIYGRFAWNPNAVPFFTLLMLLSLANGVESGKKIHRLGWILLAAFAMSISAQLYFITFFLSPFIFFVFLIWHRKIVDLRLVLAVLGMVFLVNLPIIISEQQTGWRNTINLKQAILGKTDISDSKSEPGKKIIESFQKTSFYGWTGISADQNLETVKIYRKKSGKLALKCSAECRSKLPHLIWAIFFCLSGFLLLLFRCLKEKTGARKNFLVLNFLLSAGFFLVLTPIVKNDHARFYLLVPFVFLVFAGLWMEFIEKIIKGKVVKFILAFLVIGLFVQNIIAVKGYFQDLKKISDWESDFEKKEGIIFPEGEATTFIQLEKIAELIERDVDKNGISEVVLAVDNFYARSLAYILNERGKSPVSRYFKLSDFDPPFVFGDVYYIVRIEANRPFDDEVSGFYDVVSKKEAGTLVVYRLKAKSF